MSNVCTAPPLLTPYPFTVNVADAAAAGRPTSVPFRCYRCRSPLTVAAGSLLPPTATTVAVDVPCHIDRLHGSTPSFKPPPFAVDVVDAAVPLAAPPPYRSVAIFYRHRQLSLDCSPLRKRRSPPATPPRPLAVAARAPASHEQGNKFDFGTPNPLDSFIEMFKCTVIIANSGSS